MSREELIFFLFAIPLFFLAGRHFFLCLGGLGIFFVAHFILIVEIQSSVLIFAVHSHLWHVEHLHERHRLSAAHIKAVPKGVHQTCHLVIHSIQLFIGNSHLIQQIGHRLNVHLFGAFDAQSFIDGLVPLHAGDEHNCHPFFTSGTQHIFIHRSI